LLRRSRFLLFRHLLNTVAGVVAGMPGVEAVDTRVVVAAQVAAARPLVLAAELRLLDTAAEILREHWPAVRAAERQLPDRGRTFPACVLRHHLRVTWAETIPGRRRHLRAADTLGQRSTLFRRMKQRHLARV
jgi:hypothetical protein